MKKVTSFLVSTFSLLIAGPAFAEAFVVVGNVPGTISLAEIRVAYFQNGGRLASGQVIVPLDYKEDNPERDEFYKRAFERSRVQMKAYWAQRIFTGKGFPPKTVDSAKDAVAQINKGSEVYIAYMKESEADPKLTVLLRLP